MDFARFESRAHEIFDSIPPEYREGVDGLSVERAAVEHPSLPEVFTLGECRSEYYPSDYGGPGEVLSIVVLFYGSFLELSRRQGDFDWEGELWETITHEVRHHLESLAAEDALEVQDYAEDQNFARREGAPFEPFFFRSGEPAGEGAFEVDRDVFVEMPVTTAEFGRLEEIRVRWGGREWGAAPPDRLGDVHFVLLQELGTDARRGDAPDGADAAAREADRGVDASDRAESKAPARDGGVDGSASPDPAAASGVEVYAVLVRKRGALEWLKDVLGGGRLEVLETAPDEEVER